MVQRQRENVAKYLYDLSKILFATTVVGNLIAWEQFSVVILIVGGMTGLVFLYWGYRFDGTMRD